MGQVCIFLGVTLCFSTKGTVVGTHFAFDLKITFLYINLGRKREIRKKYRKVEKRTRKSNEKNQHYLELGWVNHNGTYSVIFSKRRNLGVILKFPKIMDHFTILKIQGPF